MERIGSAFDLHVNAGSIHHSLVSGRTGGHHVYSRDRFGRWDRGRVELDPDIGSADTVDTDICTVRAGTVNVDDHGARRIVGTACSCKAGIRRGHARQQTNESLVGPSRLWQLLQVVGSYDTVHVYPIGLKLSGIR